VTGRISGIERGIGRLDLIVGLPGSIAVVIAWVSGNTAGTVFLVVGILMGMLAAGSLETLTEMWSTETTEKTVWSYWGATLVAGACGLGALGIGFLALFVLGNWLDPADDAYLHPTEVLPAHRGLLHAATGLWKVSGAFAMAMAFIGLVIYLVTSGAEKPAKPVAEAAPAPDPPTGRHAGSETILPEDIKVRCSNCGAKNRLPGVPSGPLTLRCGRCHEDFQYG
jgi:hypothetical protein